MPGEILWSATSEFRVSTKQVYLKLYDEELIILPVLPSDSYDPYPWTHTMKFLLTQVKENIYSDYSVIVCQKVQYPLIALNKLFMFLEK